MPDPAVLLLHSCGNKSDAAPTNIFVDIWLELGPRLTRRTNRLPVWDLSNTEITRPQAPIRAVSSTPAGEHRVQFSQCLEDVTAAVRQTPDKFLREFRLQTKPYPPRYSAKGFHWPRCGLRCEAAGAATVIRVNWVRRCASWVLLDSGDGTPR